MNNINIALTYINQTENPLKVFCNLFVYTLCKSGNQKLRIDELKSEFVKQFGLKLPNHILKACARILKKNKEIEILKNGEGYKFLTTSFDIEKFDNDLLQRKIREENLIQDLKEYLEGLDVHWEINEVRERFVQFLIESNYAYRLFENGTITDHGYDGKKISDGWYISQYIKKIELERKIQFDYILEIVKGLMIYIGLCQFTDYNQDKEEKFSGTRFFLDTKLVLRYLGYSWPELVQETRELVELVRKEYVGTIVIFRHTYLEVQSALSNEVHFLKYGGDENYELECFRKIKHHTKEKFELDLLQLERTIVEGENIEITDGVEVSKAENTNYNLDFEMFSTYIKDCYPLWKSVTVYNDVASINQIHVMRKNNYSCRFGGRKKLPIFITTNYPLITCCRDYFKKLSDEEGRGYVYNFLPIIADSALMYRLWLPKASQITNNMPALSLARIVNTAQQENELFYQKFKTGIKEFEQYSNITIDDLSETYSRKLFEITAKNSAGEYENFTEQVLAQSLEEFLQIQTSDKDKEIGGLKIQVANNESIIREKDENLIQAYVKTYSSIVPIGCKIMKFLSTSWWLFTAVLVVIIGQMLKNIESISAVTQIGSWIISGVLVLEPFAVKIIDKLLNRKISYIEKIFIKGAKTLFVKNFEKKSNEQERVFKEEIIKRSFQVLGLE